MQDRLHASLTFYRVSRGLNPLKLSQTLSTAANRRSALAGEYYAQSGILAHDNPNIAGDRYFELLPTFGVTSWDWAGENLYLTNAPGDPVEPAMAGWKSSPTHDANMLGVWDEVGFGIATLNGFVTITTLFLDRSG